MVHDEEPSPRSDRPLSLLGASLALGAASSACDASPAAHDDPTGGADVGDAEERRAIADDVASCATHCSTGALATSICTAIARSADFSTY